MIFLINNRGQAFSVFELLIAAIVAVAILFVLLPIVTNLNTNPGSSAKDSITNTLSTYKNGGSGTSPNFSITREAGVISSFDFVDKGFDSHSIILATDESLQTLFTPGIGSNSTQLTYTGATKLNAKAAVYCAVNGETLQEIVEGAVVSFTHASLPSICEETEYSPCCLVIIKRA